GAGGGREKRNPGAPKPEAKTPPYRATFNASSTATPGTAAPKKGDSPLFGKGDSPLFAAAEKGTVPFFRNSSGIASSARFGRMRIASDAYTPDANGEVEASAAIHAAAAGTSLIG